MAKYIVAGADEIGEGGRKIVEVEGRSVGVLNIDGDYYALLNQCPHAGAPLCEGAVFGAASADAPDVPISYERNRSIRCPWHQWEFDIQTGQSWYDPKNARVRKYEVETIDHDAAGSNEKVPGPYVLEGFDISIEGDFVVVDTSRKRRGSATR